MKKMLVLALAFVAFAGQAHAIEGKDKAEAVKAEIRDRAKHEARAANRVNPAAKEVSEKIAAAKLSDHLNGNQNHGLEAALSDALLLKTAREILAANKADPKHEALYRARIEGLANIGSKVEAQNRNIDIDIKVPALPGEERDKALEAIAQQSYTALVLTAGKQAANWPETTQKNMIQFLELASGALKSGKSMHESMEFAKSELKRIARVDISIEDIKRLCKLV